VCEAFDSCFRWVVPGFVMLSGLLALGDDRLGALAFYRRRLTRVAIPLAVWAAVYFWWEAWWYQYELTWPIVGKALYDGLICNHLYFLFIVLGLYVVAPPLRWALKRMPPAAAWSIAIAAYAIAWSGVVAKHVEIDVFTRWALYLPCFLAGWLLRRPGPRWTWPAAAVLVASTAWIVIGTRSTAAMYDRSDEEHAYALYEHYHPAVILQSLSAFVALRALPAGGRLRAALPRLSAATFGVYLMHELLIVHLQEWTNTWSLAWMPLTLTFEVAAVYLASTAISLLMLRVPILRLAIGG
jgi:surface polysaccharide O-acyltransferase-like enzyme